MNKPYWIIENFVKELSYTRLADEVVKQGYDLHRINGDFSKKDIEFLHGKNVICSGSIEMCKLIKKQLYDSFPVIYSTFEKYLCTRYYPIIAQHLFNDQYIILPLEYINRNLWKVYAMMGKEASIFIRPDNGEKTFNAEVLDIQDWDEYYDCSKDLKNELAIISTPKNIVGEWRFVVTKYKEILGVSSYRYQGLTTRIPSAPSGATYMVQQILDLGYYPDSVFCIDICEDSDKNYWVMELTSFSSAGLYECKMENIVRRVSEIAQEDYELFSKFNLQTYNDPKT